MKRKHLVASSLLVLASTFAYTAFAAETASGKVTGLWVYSSDGRVKFTLGGVTGNLCGNNAGDAKARIDKEDASYDTAVKLVTSAFLAGKPITISSTDTGNECHVEYIKVAD